MARTVAILAGVLALGLSVVVMVVGPGGSPTPEPAPVARAVPAPVAVVPPLPAPAAAPVRTGRPAPASPAPASSAPVTSAPAPTSTSRAAGPAGRTIPMLVTFYAARDNDPAGSTAISHPSLHDSAGGTGSYADPITFATDTRELAPGTRIYDPRVRRYFVMEDTCAECTDDWESGRTRHVDLYAGDATDAGVIDCEEALTPSGLVPIEVDPPRGRPTDRRPLYADGRCLTP